MNQDDQSVYPQFQAPVDKAPVIDEEDESTLLVHPNQFANKFRSKHELIYILEYEVGYYLPAPKYRTIKFLRDVLSGDKKLLESRNVSSERIPQYEELKIENMWNKFENDDSV